MSPMVKNILIVIAAIFAGGITIYFCETFGRMIIPPPVGMDVEDMESIKKFASEISAGSWALILLGHGLGAFVSGIIAAYFIPLNTKIFVLIVGVAFTIIGILNLFMIPHPLWFIVADLCIYIPMAVLGSKLFK